MTLTNGKNRGMKRKVSWFQIVFLKTVKMIYRKIEIMKICDLLILAYL